MPPGRTTEERAFLAENPFAERAEKGLVWLGDLSPEDPRAPGVLQRAQANATLAVAFEQRQTRFDLERAIREASGQV